MQACPAIVQISLLLLPLSHVERRGSGRAACSRGSSDDVRGHFRQGHLDDRLQVVLGGGTHGCLFWLLGIYWQSGEYSVDLKRFVCGIYDLLTVNKPKNSKTDFETVAFS